MTVAARLRSRHRTGCREATGLLGDAASLRLSHERGSLRHFKQIKPDKPLGWRGCRDDILALYAECKGNLVRVYEELAVRGIVTLSYMPEVA